MLIDARDRNRFSGEFEPVDPRAGHIPGARNVPARETVGEDGRLLAPGELGERFDGVGEDVVASCGSGVTACHTLLVLEHLGRPRGAPLPGLVLPVEQQRPRGRHRLGLSQRAARRRNGRTVFRNALRLGAAASGSRCE